MASKSRGGLSAREYAAKTAGKAMPYSSVSSKTSSSSSGLKAPTAPKTGDFKFDSSKLVPTYQAEAASIYNPQIQQIQGLQALTAAQAKDATVKTKDEFAQLLKREQENINRRGAFFSGGAIDQENRIGAQEGGAIRDIGFQEQSANLQYQGTLSEIAQAQKDYVSSKVEGAYSSAYKTFQDKIANQMNQYQLELGQYNTDRNYERGVVESDRAYALSAAASARAGANSANVYQDIESAFAKNNGNWDATAAELAKKYDVSEGSVIDNELRRRNGLAPITTKTAASEKMEAQQQAAEQMKSRALNAVSGLKTASGKSGYVGAKGFSSLFGYKDEPISGTSAASFKAKFDQAKALLTLPELQNLRGLGAMSDREFATLSAAASSLSPSMKESDFDSTVDLIETTLRNSTPQYNVNSGQNMVSVYDLNTGQAGQIPENEFDPMRYQKR